MKSFSIFVVVFIASFSPYAADASTGESDVVRVFNPKMKMTPEKLKYILSKAKLELAGFTKSEETSFETDENGKTLVKKITYYMVQDNCSRSGHWDRILRERLPREFYDPDLEKRMADELEARTNGRETEYCRFGLEIHLHVCREYHEEKRSMWSFASRVRRAVGDCNGCKGCYVSKISYEVADPGPVLLGG